MDSTCVDVRFQPSVSICVYFIDVVELIAWRIQIFLPKPCCLRKLFMTNCSNYGFIKICSPWTMFDVYGMDLKNLSILDKGTHFMM